MAEIEKHIRHRARIVERMNGGRREARDLDGAPDSGVSSSQDSSGAWSGRIRSAITLVSSIKLAETHKIGNLRDSVADMRGWGSAENRIRIAKQQVTLGACAWPSRTDCENALIAEKFPGAVFRAGTEFASGGSGVNPSNAGWPWPVSTSASSAFTASALNKPLVCASGASPIIAGREATMRESRAPSERWLQR